MARLTKEKFLIKARAKHGDKYQYPFDEIKGCQVNHTIICPVHGPFQQTPNNHYYYGCDKCGNDEIARKKQFNWNEFVEKAVKIHNGKYTYPTQKHTNMRTNITIICPKHGDFNQTPDNHLRDHGCKKCADEALSESKSKGAEQFIIESKAKFGDRFECIRVEYKNQKSRIDLLCKKHDRLFDISADNHLAANSGGCPDCCFENKQTAKKLSLEEVLTRFRNVHGDIYDYSQVDYYNGITKVNIDCKQHGVFNLTPVEHYLLERGCPTCNRGMSRGVAKICRILDAVKIRYVREYTFDDCRRINVLRYDFYLPDYDILLEYDGMQHFEPVKCWGGEEALAYIQENDRIKNEYCKNTNRKLKRIRYDECVFTELVNYLEQYPQWYKDL